VSTPLPPSQRKVLAGAAAGERVADTASRLHVSPATVKVYRTQARQNLGALTTPHAVALALVRGLLAPSEVDPLR
jgi:LuxR family transcriptional regulator, activator of conjugal transfer of Ti plasmids